MPRPRPRQLIALLAVAALFLAMMVYGAHIHHPGTTGESTHCDLCLQFGGAGGPAAPPVLACVALVLVGFQSVTSADRVESRQQSRSHRSRAPPSFST
jgi:hypothetical protein